MGAAPALGPPVTNRRRRGLPMCAASNQRERFRRSSPYDGTFHEYPWRREGIRVAVRPFLDSRSQTHLYSGERGLLQIAIAVLALVRSHLAFRAPRRWTSSGLPDIPASTAKTERHEDLDSRRRCPEGYKVGQEEFPAVFHLDRHRSRAPVEAGLSRQLLPGAKVAGRLGAAAAVADACTVHARPTPSE